MGSKEGWTKASAAKWFSSTSSPPTKGHHSPLRLSAAHEPNLPRSLNNASLLILRKRSLASVLLPARWIRTIPPEH